ncbi:MAG: tetratricopeptide repeat protein, partial [Dehalococcoidia bacterium]
MKRWARTFTLICASVWLTACTRPVATYPSGADVALFAEMGDHHRPVSANSELAQRYFDQGLTWAFAFNHDEAIRSFEQAAEFDPDCAMAWWGVALCHGPHINNAKMSDDRSAAAWAALEKAQVLKHHASAVEIELIDALSERYEFPIPEDRTPLDRAYANAMASLWQAHPGDDDIGTLYAEAMMDLRPWDLWTFDGQAQPGTRRILEVLEDVLLLNPVHPGANHLYIHAVEPSPEFRRGIAAADRLRDMVPIASHLVHMPSHIDLRTGDWDGAVLQSEWAIAADRRYLEYVPEQGFYARYMAHNQRMLAYACMMSGRSERALQAARDLIAGVPEELARSRPGVIDSKWPILYEILVRFGMWEDMLAEPAPPEYLPLSNTIWHIARGVSYAATGNMEAAERERDAFLVIARELPDDAKFENSLASDFYIVADLVLRGEIAFHRGDIEESIELLRSAAELEDRLAYDEPPIWVIPVRHALGAVLVQAGRYDEAEEIYREDLETWPHNGWSLHGLATALRGQGRAEAANETDARFERAWAHADM